MSRFMEYMNDSITAYKEGRLGDAFNDLTDASIALEEETLAKREENTSTIDTMEKGNSGENA